jgi:hypothetical protein
MLRVEELPDDPIVLKRVLVDPQRYLTSVLAKIGTTPPDELEQFLPDVWKYEPRPAAGSGPAALNPRDLKSSSTSAADLPANGSRPNGSRPNAELVSAERTCN